MEANIKTQHQVYRASDDTVVIHMKAIAVVTLNDKTYELTNDLDTPEWSTLLSNLCGTDVLIVGESDAGVELSIQTGKARRQIGVRSPDGFTEDSIMTFLKRTKVAVQMLTKLWLLVLD